MTTVVFAYFFLLKIRIFNLMTSASVLAEEYLPCDLFVIKAKGKRETQNTAMKKRGHTICNPGFVTLYEETRFSSFPNFG